MAKKIFNIFTTIVLIVLCIFVVAMFLTRLTGNTPEVFGFRVFRVVTGSMEPTLKIGDVVLVKETPAEDIHKGDIITYWVTDGSIKGRTITHRVTEDPVIDRGEYVFRTQGDVEGSSPDPEVSYDDVVGKYVCKLTVLGWMYSFFCKPYGLVAFIGLIIVLFGYEMITMLVSYRSLDKIDDEFDKLGDEKSIEEKQEDEAEKEESESETNTNT